MSGALAGKILRGRLFANEFPETMPGIDENYRELLQVLRRCVRFGESNSVLLTGPRGSGKSLVTRQALQQLKNDQDLANTFSTVYLNGLVQTDSRRALRAIASQLNQTLNEDEDLTTSSFAASLSALLAALKKGDRRQRALVFVLDEFDQFTHHHNQLLLYNLLDIAQTAATPLSIVALTCHLDVMSALEKRVESRFSHRHITFLHPVPFDLYLDICRAVLELPASFADKAFRQKFNKNVNECFLKDAGVLEVLTFQHQLSFDVRDLHRLLTIPVCLLSDEEPFLQGKMLTNPVTQPEHGGKMAMLQGLTVIEFCLLVALLRLAESRQDRIVNFEMMFLEYCKFAEGRLQVSTKVSAFKAFEHLLALKLIRWFSGRRHRSKNTPTYFRPVALALASSQLQEVLQKSGCPMELLRLVKQHRLS